MMCEIYFVIIHIFFYNIREKGKNIVILNKNLPLWPSIT